MAGTMQNNSSHTFRAGQGPGSQVPWSADLVAVGAAVVCVLVMWLSFAAWGGVDLSTSMGGQPREIGLASVALTATVTGLLGVSALRLLERRSTAGLRIWTLLVVGVTLVSALGPLSATSTAATGVLLGMHAIVALVLIVSAHRNRRWV